VRVCRDPGGARRRAQARSWTQVTSHAAGARELQEGGAGEPRPVPGGRERAPTRTSAVPVAHPEAPPAGPVALRRRRVPDRLAAVPAAVPPRRALPPYRAGARGGQPRVGPRPPGLRAPGLGLRPGATLPREGVGVQGDGRVDPARGRADPGGPRLGRRPHVAVGGRGRPRRGQRRRDLPGGLGHPGPRLVADGVPHRGGPPGAGHRRRGAPGGAVGAAAAARLPRQEAAPAAAHTDRVPRRRADRPVPAACRAAGRPAADHRTSPGDDRPHDGPRARPAGRTPRGAGARAGPQRELPGDLPGGAA
jgi:hypothetical protein